MIRTAKRKTFSRYLFGVFLMTMTATQISNGLKVLYAGQRASMVVNGSEARPFYNDLTKPKDFSGDTKPIPVYYEDSAGGRHRTLATAQSQANQPQIGKFAIDVVEDNQVVRITTDAFLRARNDKGSFLSQQALRIDNGLNNMANQIEKSLFNTGTGVVGRMNNSSFSTTTLDLVNDEDAKLFQKGAVYQFAATETGAVRSGTLTCASVDIGATSNQVEFTADIDVGITSPAQNDYIFQNGDAQNGGSSALGISGLPAWLPTTVTATAFFGQDRTDDPVRLGGIKSTGSFSDVAKAITDACAKIHDLVPAAAPKVAYINPITWGKLSNQLSQDVQRDPGGNGVAGFRYLSVQGAQGEVKCKPASYCKQADVYLIDLDVWALESMLDPVRINDDDGQIARAIYNQSGTEVRVDSHAQLSCSKPGYNARITLS
jgi:hypothetical protein